MNQQHLDFEELLALNKPELINDWLESVWNGERAYSDEVNSWLFVYEGLYAKAIYHRKKESHALLEWVLPALRILEYLTVNAPLKANGFRLKAMNLRVLAIKEYGHEDGSHILDVTQVFESFYDSIQLPQDQVIKESFYFHEKTNGYEKGFPPSKSTLEKMRKIRYIKSCLGPIEILANCGYRQQKSDNWLALRPKLI